MAFKTSRSLLLLLIAGTLCAADRYRASEPHMGTLVTITLYAGTEQQAQKAFLAAFQRIGRLNEILSDYNSASELSRVCDTREPLSPELLKVLTFAQHLAASTNGAFDITSGPLTRLWRTARHDKRAPSPRDIAEALSRSGYRKLRISKSHGGVQCLTDGMQLDAGGIAKGFAADEALAAIQALGIRSALVAVSGDLAIGDPPPGRSGWTIQVRNQTLSLANVAVSTSGDEFQFTTIDGVRYSHIINPRNGLPLRNSKPVSVIAKTGIMADSLATAISVLGVDAAQSLIQEAGVRVIVH